MSSIEIVIVTTNQGDRVDSSKQNLLDHLNHGWKILASNYVGHGHVDYILQRLVIT